MAWRLWCVRGWAWVVGGLDAVDGIVQVHVELPPSGVVMQSSPMQMRIVLKSRYTAHLLHFLDHGLRL